MRERLNGYYGAAAYTAASAVSAGPFLAIMSFTCSLVVYFLAGLNTSADRFFYFVLNLFCALMVVCSHSPATSVSLTFSEYNSAYSEHRLQLAFNN